MESWFTSPPSDLLRVLVSTIGIYAAVLVATRIVGLRSFSKMSSADFAMTVAVGSLMASTLVSPSPPLLAGVVGLASLYGCQFALTKLRTSGFALRRYVDNEPLLLMHGQRMIRENMRAARVTENDLIAKLREANVLQLSDVRAVVFETTGDISVLHSAGEEALGPHLLSGVRPRPSEEPLTTDQV